MPGLLPASGTVNDRGFVERLVNAGQSGQINNRSEAEFLPLVGNDQNVPEPVIIGQKLNGLDAQ
ncbi:hypothetical protein D3C81_2318360 [compost metagenome]